MRADAAADKSSDKYQRKIHSCSMLCVRCALRLTLRLLLHRACVERTEEVNQRDGQQGAFGCGCKPLYLRYLFLALHPQTTFTANLRADPRGGR